MVWAKGGLGLGLGFIGLELELFSKTNLGHIPNSLFKHLYTL
jgi:hypothetical protein